MRRLALYSTLTIAVAVILACAYGWSWAASADQPSSQAKGEPGGETTSVGVEPKETAPKATPRVRVYNTGDYDPWPSISFPIVYKIEVPEVPKGIASPATPIPPDAE